VSLFQSRRDETVVWIEPNVGMSTVDPWEKIDVGTLTDADIRSLAAVAELITGEFEPASIKQACYELRASDTFWDVASPVENKRVVGDMYLLGPKRSVVCIVKESLSLPADVLGRVLTKGQLFSIGILPVNTYADPGFQGRLGITFWNASNRYIVIRPNDPIAKIEFQRLPKAVESPYSGQHGYETTIWPIPVQFFADMDDPAVRQRIGDVPTELERSFGESVADLSRDVSLYARKVWLQLAMTISLFAVIFALHGKISLFYSLGLGVLANLATFFLLPILSHGSARLFGRR
jgi:dCTP deaminase